VLAEVARVLKPGGRFAVSDVIADPDMDDATRADMRPWLADIRCPLLVACGDGDLLTPQEHSREIAHAVPHARLEVVPGAGHLMTWEQPERVNALLLQWLADLQPVASRRV